MFSGLGGLAVSMLPSGTQDRGFEPGRSRRIFSGVKIHSMPSFRMEVKQRVRVADLWHVKDPERVRGSRFSSAQFVFDCFTPD
jgi:hypothetical protein